MKLSDIPKPVYRPPSWIWPLGCGTWALIIAAVVLLWSEAA